MQTEPTVMISGDVMELQHLIYAEREAHAAEVARLRAALMKSLSNLYAVRISECHAPNAKTAERYSFTNEADANEVEAAIDLMRSALAAAKEK